MQRPSAVSLNIIADKPYIAINCYKGTNNLCIGRGNEWHATVEKPLCDLLHRVNDFLKSQKMDGKHGNSSVKWNYCCKTEL